MSEVKIKFDSNQEYQINAVNAVIDLFDGREKLELEEEQILVSDDTYPNADEYEFLSDHCEELEENLFKVKRNPNNNVPKNIQCLGLSPENDGETLTSSISNFDSFSYPQFTINMETGTGKTYVYLRPIYELRERYGFSKFIIIVPSVAIFEGVVSTFKSTLAHFKSLYGPNTVPEKIIEYDGKVENCKNFATSNYINMMVMTIDSFNKTSNVIYKSTDKIMGGKLPINYIQETRPILILDEVQNYQSVKSLAALRTLHPYFSIGYSATPTAQGSECPNLLYKLSSFDALQLDLVKKIEIYGTEEELSGAGSEDFVRVNLVQSNSGRLEAHLELQEKIGGSLKLKTFILHQGDKLAEKTKNTAYGELTVTDMSSNEDNMYLELSNSKKYYVKESDIHTLTQQSVFRQMIRNTIQTHIEKKRLMKICGYDAKILTLFFIDHVSNYNGSEPIIKKLFDEEFDSLKSQDPDFENLTAEEVRCAYFAKKIDSKTGNEDYFDSFDEISKKERDKAEKEAYNLIMRGKEELLSNQNKVCFIFAHSALREGWDNPNVFQICSLRDIKSVNARRQTIGRGLRLPVGQNGERIRDKRVNLLTVIADESYSDFVRNLQTEYEEDETILKQMFKKHSEKKKINRNANFMSTKFLKLWTQMNQKTSYRIHINTDNLIEKAVNEINNIEFASPKIITSKAKMVITKYKITVTEVQPDGNFATILLETADSNGKKFENNREEIEVKVGSILDKNHNYLSKFKVSEIHYDDSPEKRHSVVFKDLDATPFELGVSQEFDTTSGQHIQAAYKEENLPDIPKCNLLERTEKEVPLTRKTILSIFKGLKEDVQMKFIKNPEGFISQFVEVLKEIYADHVAENIEYVDDSSPMSFKVNGNIVSNDSLGDSLFLEHPEISVYEMEAANENISIYDYIQVDSEVERNFVRTLNNSAEYNYLRKGKVELYFKFPPQYKIMMPKVIGNYNPDWAITYKNENSYDLYLVRETKSTEDLDRLWHTSEKRKIKCAEKHFRSIGVRYRPVDDKDENWYLSEDEANKLEGMQTDLYEKK